MSGQIDPQRPEVSADSPWEKAMDAFRDLALAIIEYRHATAVYFEVGFTETIAVSYLARADVRA